MRRLLWVAAVASLIAGCGGSRGQRDLGQAPSPPRQALRYGPECDSIIRLAVEKPSSLKIYPPTPMHIEIPRTVAGERQRNRPILVHLLVNEKGRVDPGGSRIEGAVDVKWAEELAKMLMQWEFKPASADGCAIPARTTITVTRQ
jgi:hypothetical protein